VNFVWETSNEVGHAGFQLYARDIDGWTLLSPELIIGGPVATEMQTNRYVYQAASDAKWFALVDVSNTEEVTPHGPFQVGQDYGANLDEPSAFDWSGLDAVPTQSKDEVRRLIESRLESLQDDGVEFDDAYNDALFEDFVGDDDVNQPAASEGE